MSSSGFSCAVIGMDFSCAGINTADNFWQILTERKTTYGQSFEKYHAFDASFFHYAPKEAMIMDPQQRKLLESAYKALEDAGYAWFHENYKTGVFCGIGMNYYAVEHHLYEDDQVAMSEVMHTNHQDYAALRLAFQLNLTGPALTIQTACSSSLASVYLACQSIASGQCLMALAGGVSLLPSRVSAQVQGGMLSPSNQCLPFDHQSDGTVFSSGYGMIVLKQLAHAIEDGDRIYAVIRGGAMNNDGKDKLGFTAPSIGSQSMLLHDALAHAKIAPGDLSFIEAHGTATTLGDLVEMSALHRIFGQEKKPIALHSVKGNIGHLLAASGIAGCIKSVQMLFHRTIVPQPFFSQIHTNLKDLLDPFFIPHTQIPIEDNDQTVFGGVSSFGVGGTNVHLIISSYRPQKHMNYHANIVQDKPVLCVFSGPTMGALQRIKQQWLSHSLPNASLFEVAKSLRHAQKSWPYREAWVVSSMRELCANISLSCDIQPCISEVKPMMIGLDVDTSLLAYRDFFVTLFHTYEEAKVFIQTLPASLLSGIRSYLLEAEEPEGDVSAKIWTGVLTLMWLKVIEKYCGVIDIIYGKSELGSNIAWAFADNSNYLQLSQIHPIHQTTCQIGLGKCIYPKGTHGLEQPGFYTGMIEASRLHSILDTSFNGEHLYPNYYDFLDILGQWWCQGKFLFPNYAGCRYHGLPLYPFEETIYQVKHSQQSVKDKPVSTRDEPESSSLKSQVRQIWLTCLGLTSIDDDDDFFALGGHSMMAIHLLSQINENFEHTLKMDDLYDINTVNKMVVHLTASSDTSSI